MIYKTDHFTLDTSDLSIRTPEGGLVRVYNRDFELLRYLCSRNGEAATSMEIIEAVWDRNAEYSSNVVAASVSNIRRRLGKDAIETVRGRYLVRCLPSQLPAEPQVDAPVGDHTSVLPTNSSTHRKIPKEFFILSASVLLSAIILAGIPHLLGATTSTSSGQFSISALDVDPEGNDNDNLDKESVTLKNVTDHAIDVTGWSVMDEMGHRYVFPKRVVRPGAEVRIVT